MLRLYFCSVSAIKSTKIGYILLTITTWITGYTDSPILIFCPIKDQLVKKTSQLGFFCRHSQCVTLPINYTIDQYPFHPSSLQLHGWHLLNQHGHGKGKRKLLQSPIHGPYSPLSVAYNGKTCILFKAKRLAIRYQNRTFVDLTERTFGPNAPVDTKGSICTEEKAT
jgi:hypothetical protein